VANTNTGGGRSSWPPPPRSSRSYKSIGWTAAIHGNPAALFDDGEWLAADFDGAATAANLELNCNQCGWSKTVAAGGWEAR
jgi:hypothetical protein